MSEDSAPLLSELFAKHRSELDLLAEMTLPHHRADDDDHIQVPIDDLFLLRFLLSSKSDLRKASENVAKTLAFRRENARELRAAREHQGRFSELAAFVVEKSFIKYLGFARDEHLGVCVLAGRSDQREMVRHVKSADELARIFLITQHEYSQMLIDAQSRKTGRLCKSFVVLDCTGFALSRVSFDFMRAQGAASNLAAVYYPQSVLKQIVLNPPWIFDKMFMVYKTVASKSAVEKLHVHHAKATAKNDIRECPFVSKFGANGVNLIPDIVGGKLHIVEFDNTERN